MPQAISPGPAGLKFWRAPGLSADNTDDTGSLPAGIGDQFNPWGPKRPVKDFVCGTSPSLIPAAITFSADASSYALTGFAATFPTAAVSDTTNLPAGGANWFNPWGRKRPVQDWLRGPIPAVPVIFTAAGGSYILTGTAAAMAFGHVVGSGTYSITGSAAALARGHVAGAGNYSLSGTAAGLTGAVNLAAAAGSYTITGSAATFAFGHVAGASSYALTGSAAALVIPGVVTTYLPAGMTGGYVPWRRPPRQYWVWSVAYSTVAGGVTLSAGAGNYTLSGSVAGLTATTLRYIFRPPLITRIWSRSRQVSVSAQNWVLRNKFIGSVSLSAGTGSYAITGSSAALALRLTASSGAHSVSAGSAAVLARGFAAGAGAYVITGTTAQTVQAGTVTLVAGTGSYAITGSSAALALRLTASSGAHSVSGSAAVLARGFAAGAGAYVITGTTAQTVQAGTVTLVAGTGGTAITGSSAALALRLTASSGAHSVSAGSAAVLARGFAAGAGAYVITGTAAALTASSVGLSMLTPPERRFKIATEKRAAMIPAATVVGKVSEDQRMAFVE